MTITLGAVTLNQHVSWRGYFNDGIPGEERRTLGNRLIVSRLSPSDGHDIILEAIEEDNIRKGYFTHQQLQQLNIYKRTGEVIVLNYHNVIFNVVIIHNGINVEKTLWKSENSSDDRYIGTISMKIV